MSSIRNTKKTKIKVFIQSKRRIYQYVNIQLHRAS